MGRIERIRPLSIAAGVAVLIGLVALAIAFDWNWFKGPIERYASEVTGRPFAIRGDLDVDPGSVIRFDAEHVFLGNPLWASSLRMEVDTEPPGPDDASSPIVAKGTGRYRNGRFTLSASVDSPLRLLEDGRAYRVEATAQACATRVRVHGKLRVPIDPDRFELRAEFSGQDLADLHPLAGIPVPESTPCVLRASLARDGRIVRYRGFEGTLGDKDVVCSPSAA